MRRSHAKKRPKTAIYERTFYNNQNRKSKIEIRVCEITTNIYRLKRSQDYSFRWENESRDFIKKKSPFS